MNQLGPSSILGHGALITFALSYLAVIFEEPLKLKKCQPVMLAAGLIWILCFAAAAHQGVDIGATFNHVLVEYSHLFLFLLVAVSFVNVIEARGLFTALQGRLLSYRLSYRQLFWLCSGLAFFLSGLLDNLTTTLVLSAVVLQIGAQAPRFVSLSCIALVIAANAGGVFSPFGDITTLMVWQAGKLPFEQFFKLFWPALVNYLVPALFLQLALPKGRPEIVDQAQAVDGRAKLCLALFAMSLVLTVVSHHFLHVPPVLTMMTGLSLLILLDYFYDRNGKSEPDTFQILARTDWDTFLFFYGVMLSVGGLAAFGYLQLSSNYLYQHLGQGLAPAYQASPAHVLLGLASALIDNIPVMFAILKMQPVLSAGQWLLITLTTGVGGSVLSIGSAAGVALMGQAPGHYTFKQHLRWSPVILLGYFVSIICHHYLNAASF